MEDYKLDPTAPRQEVRVQAHMILVFLKPLAKAITRGNKHSCSGGIHGHGQGARRTQEHADSHSIL